MAPLGPFELAPKLAVAVSGGADSLVLALLADAWARGRAGDVFALIVDHALRPASAGEAAATLERLANCGIAARILTLTGLVHGPALAARARAARYAALSTACAEAGLVHLLLGHHAGDQAETLAMRMLAGSGPAGLACMPALSETAPVRLLRPLLTVPPGRLRATLAARGVAWVDDPSNADPAAQRARLRAARGDRDGGGPVTRAAAFAASLRGRARAAEEYALAALLARCVHVTPEGFALVSGGALPAAALAALLRVVAGADWSPSAAAVAALAAAPRAATLGGVRMLPAGRLLHGGWLIVREAAAMAPPMPAGAGAVWDGRFRLQIEGIPVAGAALGALGVDAAQFRSLCDLPSAVLRTLPAVRAHGGLLAVPHLGYRRTLLEADYRAVFSPGGALAPAPFRTSGDNNESRVPVVPGA